MITKYKIFESLLTDKDKIKNWLDRMNIKNYTINDDLSVDVDDDVSITIKNLTEIPVQFGKVNGNFYCYINNLINLKYCPSTITGDFSCHINKLTSLKYCPSNINGHFSCSHNNLINLKYCPNIIKGNMNFSVNPLEDINDLDSKILIKIMKNININTEVLNKYFEHWITKDPSIVEVLKDKVSDEIKQKYSHYFNASNFDLI